MSGERQPEVTVEFPDDFDVNAEEIEAKGWYSGVVVVVDGTRHALMVYDPVRLAQDVRAELEAGRPFAEPHLVVVPSVTRTAIEGAVRALACGVGWSGRAERLQAPSGSSARYDAGLQYGPLTILVGLEAIRRRPGMYIGPGRTTANRLSAVAIAAMVRSGGGSNRVLAEVREDGSLTVRAATALAPMGVEERGGIAQPEVVDAMLRILAARGRAYTWLDGQGSILVALASQLGVSCRSAGLRLDAWFARGGLVAPISRTGDDGPDATAIGLLPDPERLTGSVDVAGVRRELEEIAPECVAYLTIEEAPGDHWDVLGTRLRAPSYPG